MVFSSLLTATTVFQYLWSIESRIERRTSYRHCFHYGRERCGRGLSKDHIGYRIEQLACTQIARLE